MSIFCSRRGLCGDRKPPFHCVNICSDCHRTNLTTTIAESPAGDSAETENATI